MSDHGHHGEHITPLIDYFKVYGALLVLTVITVAISFMGLGVASIYVAMAVAAVKALLVASIFMHLKWDEKFNVLVFSASVLFMVIFFGFTAMDLGSRGMINPENGTFVLRNELSATAAEEKAAAAAEAAAAETAESAAATATPAAGDGAMPQEQPAPSAPSAAPPAQ